jgi:hypothetical protein
MAWLLDGKLAGAKDATIAMCRVEVLFDLKVPVATSEAKANDTDEESASAKKKRTGSRAKATAPTFELVASRASAQSDTRGAFTLRLPDKGDIGSDTLHFIVSAPSGETIADTEHSVSRLKEIVQLQVRSVKQIEVDKAPPARPPETVDTTSLVRAVTGRVIERNGKPLPTTMQVLLYASHKRDRKDDKTAIPVLVSKTDASGYFSGEVPNIEFDHAFAQVSGVTGDLHVPLEKERIPSRVILVIELPRTSTVPVVKDGDCNCKDANAPPRTPTQTDIANAPGVYSTDLGTGRCVDFNTPNRAIEEFSFFSVVRTTEPEIRGYTVGDPTFGRPTAAVAAPPPLPSTGRVAETGGQPVMMMARNALMAVPVGGQPGGIPMTGGVSLIEAANVPAASGPGGGAATFARLNADTVVDRLHLAEGRLTNLGMVLNGYRTAVAPAPRPPGRMQLDANNPVDWDSTPTFYEASTIAHGHLLHFKQVWYADGYSLGDLLYSLPLAPGQKKLISVVDWERREQTSRTEDTFASESLTAALSRDRDLNEVVTGTLSESSRGGSRNTTAGAGVGTGAAGNGSYQGFNFGALMGISGGYGESNSSAWQDSARNLASTSLQNLRDRTLQSASAIRSLRSSVVHTATQGEAVRATTEVVANHNHCHAITIQYFEVLRHLKVTQELVDVQECLFVPLPMTLFDRNKAIRWRQSLQMYLQRRELLPAFDAARRVETSWSEVNYPAGRYADEIVTALIGEFRLTIIIPLPPIPELPKPDPADTAAEVAAKTNEALNPTTGFFGAILAVATGGLSLVAGAATSAAITATQAATQGARALAESMAAENSPQRRYERFQQEVMPGAAAGFVNTLELYALIDSNEVRITGADFTLVSDYQPGVPLLVALRANVTFGRTRDQIRELIIKSGQGLPEGCRAIINSAAVRYQTQTFEHTMINDDRVNDDIDPPGVAVTFSAMGLPVIAQTTPGTGAALFTPTDVWEQRNPRIEDIRLATELVEHLNDNLEYYHHAIWWTMDPNRRFMLLDGYYAPGSNQRSVASVVENRLIGMAGNSLIMPVAKGVHLDPRFASSDDGIKLLAHYKPALPDPGARVSLPTRGVFAEAVMGSCNACEKIDDSTFWRWEESPIDEPPVIQPTSTDTRRTQPDTGQPTAFPTPMVSIQNAPAAPDPTGMRAALELLGRQSFADITGLAGTQANAAMAYSKAMDTALAFGKEASTLAQQASMQRGIDRTMGAIDKAEAEGKIDTEKARDLRTSALRKLVGDGGDSDAESVEKKLETIQRSRDGGLVTDGDARAIGKNVLATLAGSDSATQQDHEVTNELVSGLESMDVESIETKTAPDGTEEKKINMGGGGGGGGGTMGLVSRIANQILMGQVPPAVATAAVSGLSEVVKSSGVGVAADITKDAIKETARIVAGEVKEISKRGNVKVNAPSPAGAVVFKKYPDPSDYYPIELISPAQAKRKITIQFANLADDGVGDGLKGKIDITWDDECTNHAIPGNTKTVRALKSVRFKKNIRVLPALTIGRALESATVTVLLDDAPDINWQSGPPRANVTATIRIETVPKDSILAVGGQAKVQDIPIPLDTGADPLGLKGYRIVNSAGGDVDAPFDLLE